MLSIRSLPTDKVARGGVWLSNRRRIAAEILAVWVSLLIVIGGVRADESTAEQAQMHPEGGTEGDSRSPENVIPVEHSDRTDAEGRRPDAERRDMVSPDSAKSSEPQRVLRVPAPRESGADRTGKDREPHGESIDRALDRY